MLKEILNSKFSLVLLSILLVLVTTVVLGASFFINLNIYNSNVGKYNALLKLYNKSANTDEKEYKPRVFIQNNTGGYVYAIMNGLGPIGIFSKNKQVVQDVAVMTHKIMVDKQICNPKEHWVVSRLKRINRIGVVEAVKPNKDPNWLLGEEKGYTACVYFSSKELSFGSSEKLSVIEKGTDAGGCVEVYANKEDAKARDIYLSQFDNTLLCSGSHALCGTMVIRTSVLLGGDQQIQLTKAIVEAFVRL